MIRYRRVCVSNPNVVSYIAPRFIVSAATRTGKAHATPPVVRLVILLRRRLDSWILIT